MVVEYRYQNEVSELQTDPQMSLYRFACASAYTAYQQCSEQGRQPQCYPRLKTNGEWDTWLREVSSSQDVLDSE